GILSVAQRAGAVEPMAERATMRDRRRWKIKRQDLRILVSRAAAIADALPELRKLFSSPESYRVAITVPPGLGSLERFYAGFENTSLGLRRLAEEAKQEVCLVVPFLDRQGVETVSPSLEAALRRGVRVSIVTRRLDAGGAHWRALDALIVARHRAGGDL